MMSKPYAMAVRIYEKSDGTTMADIKTPPCDGLRTETIVWTNRNEREKFFYNGYTLFYDERTVKVKPFNEIK